MFAFLKVFFCQRTQLSLSFRTLFLKYDISLDVFNLFWSFLKQLKNLSRRVVNLKYAIGLAAAGFLFDLLTVFTLYIGELFVARLIFGLCCLSLIISIVFYLVEIIVSTNALKLHLSDMKIDDN